MTMPDDRDEPPTERLHPSREPARLTPRQQRDLLAVTCIGTGVVGLVGVAWAAHWLAGLAASFALLLGIGVVVGLDR